MRADGMRARVARVYRPKAGTHRWFSQHPNHVRRTQATRPDQIWVGDVTYLAVGGRWWFLAVSWTSARVGCSRGGSRRPRLAPDPRGGGRGATPAPAAAGLIFHSDRGSEFLGTLFRARLTAGVCAKA